MGQPDTQLRAPSYKSVKDHRTNLQSTNPDAVLGGGIDRFIEAYLMSKVGE